MPEGRPSAPKKPNLRELINELYSIANSCMEIEGVKKAGENTDQFISRVERLKSGRDEKDPESINELESIRLLIGDELFKDLIEHLR